MEQILCLTTKRTDETVLICGESFGHKGPHFDPEDKISWDDEKEAKHEFSSAPETTQGGFSPADVHA